MKKCDFCEYDRGPNMDKPKKCKECRDFNNFIVKNRLTQRESYLYEKFKKDEEWANNKDLNFDRDTALMVLRDLSTRMHASRNLFGEDTLVINRYEFELVRKKYLDKKE